MTKGNKGKNRGNTKDQIERKRDERARRNALRKEREAKEYLENDENFVSFSNQLQALGYKIKDIKGDGNCLFRALADQLDGTDDGHLRYRRIIAKYLADHREEYEPFVEDNKTFDEHVRELNKAGTFGGNDSIVAFSRCYGLNIVIHQLNERCWVIHGEEYKKPGDPFRELHISYHNGDHYSSVRRISDPDDGPAWLFNNQHKVTKEAVGSVGDKAKRPNKQKTKNVNTAVYDEATAVDGTSDIAIIQAATGCQDLELIQQTLLESDSDLDSTISYILQLQSLNTVEVPTEGLAAASNFENDVENQETNEQNTSVLNKEKMEAIESPPGTINVADQELLEKMAKGGAIPKTKQATSNSRKRKHLAKQEKKARRMEEKRQEIKNKKSEQKTQNIVSDNTTVTDFLDLQALAI
ncbi:OTU domain-containing protein 3-like [Dendronephthya gigantea]|uniref:OTU domain-containing protein 3-like n=1 Tax=Dendronephthya gigantea TaxID=151771 RepID=UPI00106A21B1|nr:OTU domain-containing protein 3-like [Dendronephthya gigantea]